MTNTQVERLQQILEEQCVLAKDYAKQQYGRKNGEDFPDLVRAAMANKEFRGMISGNILAIIMLTMLGGTKNFAEKIRGDDGMDVIADDQLYNGIALDSFWLGYQAGRQMEREESRVLNQIAEDSRDGQR